MKAQSRCSPDCICFPENEQPEFKWQAEAEMAAAVLCPLHGLRFRIVVTGELYFVLTSPALSRDGRANPHSIKKRRRSLS